MSIRVFTRKTTSNGVVQYRNVTENIIVKKDDLDAKLLARLDAAPEGTHVSESSDILPDAGEEQEIAAGVATRKIRLQRNLLVNGVVFVGGKDIEVPEAQADDLLRIDREHTEYELSLVRRNDQARTSDVRVQDVQ